MVDRLKAYISEQHFFPAGRQVLLAVSGGRDSVCMARLFREAAIPIAIAHCNFHLRPGDCDRDQRFVETLAAEMGVRCFTASFDTHTYARSRGMSDEEAARELRYCWFAKLCSEHGFPCVATAHHRDDSIETFFLNLFRGTGIAGLHGIQPCSQLNMGGLALAVVHPMLCFSRAEINGYIQSHGYAFVEDSTNSLMDARRNQLRLRLMPLLRELYPSVDATMQANMERLADVERVYNDAIESFRNRLVQPLPRRLPTTPCPMVAISLDDLPEPRATILYELLRPYGFNADTVGSMLSNTQSAGRLFHSPTHIATTSAGSLVVAPICEPSEPVVVEAVGSGAYEPGTATVDADQLRRPLRVRLWREGDRFCPFGMEQQRKVSDYLKDQKINRIEKQYVYLLTDADDRIVWVVGLCADNRFRVTDATRSVVRFSV